MRQSGRRSDRPPGHRHGPSVSFRVAELRSVSVGSERVVFAQAHAHIPRMSRARLDREPFWHEARDRRATARRSAWPSAPPLGCCPDHPADSPGRLASRPPHRSTERESARPTAGRIGAACASGPPRPPAEAPSDAYRRLRCVEDDPRPRGVDLGLRVARPWGRSEARRTAHLHQTAIGAPLRASLVRRVHVALERCCALERR